MKKLYSKGTVHPSTPIISDQLSYLPATILTLTAALSPEDREVLAYLISCSNNNNNNININKNNKFSSYHRKSTQEVTTFNIKKNNSSNDHLPQFNCDCFRCYMSYWVRWDSSPNRQLIHEIIDAFEDGLLVQRKTCNNKNKKENRKRKGNSGGSVELKPSSELSLKNESTGSDTVENNTSGDDRYSISDGGGGGGGGCGEEEGSERGSVRRFVSFIGERIWGVLG